MGLLEGSAERARAAGWNYLELDATHGAPALNPDAVATALGGIA
jgi:hypothetical protein